MDYKRPQRTIIVGGGVVGLHLARRLAERGEEVELHESRREVSEGADRASGILSISGLKKIGLDHEDSIVNTLYGAYLVAGSERLRIASGRPMAYVLDRKRLAKSCERAAIKAGARIRLGSRLVKTDLQEMSHDRSNLIIGADGAVSMVASTFGFPAIREYVLTYKAEFRSEEIEETGMVGLYFSRGFAKGLFGWHVPYSSDTVELGLGIDHRARLTSSAAFSYFMKDKASTSVVKTRGRALSSHASMIPLSTRPKTAKGNVALVGDAAGQVKATTGGGIIYGCLCAETLSRTISSGKPLSEYERSWRASYGRDLGFHRLAHSYYSKGNLQRTFRILKVLGMDGFLARYGDMDSPSLILKRFLLRGLA
ncbi:MAG: NAD(P)/FAD-dependent oxidoreductase [Candidatus Micrarchaeota archaeon]|nr:NAD(P)/FAD-dependent oxidoreductase [Candidatus Micrarchaeota archaeon]